MIAALRGRYVQYVVFMGVPEKYPKWFIEEISNRVFVNESRYCFWVSPPERDHDYYEKEMIETYSVVIRKSNGEVHITEFDTFNDLYRPFKYDQSINGGIAAFKEDIIEYVDCTGGHVVDVYPKWFYEYFTESLNNPREGESYLLGIDGSGHINVKERCVFLRNRFGEIKQMSYEHFLKHYDPMTQDERWWEDCPF